MPYPTKKLWEISDFQWGSQPPKKEFIFEYKEWYIRFLQIRDFSNDKNITYIPKWNKNKLCVEDDILIWRYWASVWKILIWIAGAYNVALMKTFPDLSLIEKRFFYYYLKSDIFQIPLLKVSARAAQAWFSKKDIEDFLIPLPPLPTQKLIVQKLDSAFKNIDESIKITKKNIENIEELNKSVLNGVFNDWQFKEEIFWEICDFVRWPFWGSLKKEIFKKSWYAVYEQMHAIWDQYEEIRYYIDEKKFNEMKRFELLSWNLIMSCSGTMWKISIVPEWIKKWIINQALLVLKPRNKLINEYLKLFMESWVFQEEITKYSKWAAIKNVASVKILKQIKIPLPPLSKQKEIVAYLDEVFEKNKEIKEWYEKKLKDLEEMKQSILKEAFENEEFVK